MDVDVDMSPHKAASSERASINCVYCLRHFSAEDGLKWLYITLTYFHM